MHQAIGEALLNHLAQSRCKSVGFYYGQLGRFKSVHVICMVTFDPETPFGECEGGSNSI